MEWMKIYRGIVFVCLVFVFLLHVCIHGCPFFFLSDAVNLFLQKLFLVVPEDNPDEVEWE